MPGRTGVTEGRIVFQRSNFAQLGHVSGQIRVQERTFDVGPSWVGARDHSWGLGDTGGGKRTNPYAAPPPGGKAVDGAATIPDFGLRQWALVRFPEALALLLVSSQQDGRFTTFESHVAYPYESDRRPWSYRKAEIESIEFETASGACGRPRWLSSATAARPSALAWKS